MLIETDALTKRYGSTLACNNVSISVGAGEIFGFLGPNGAGKSTCIKMLIGLIFPTSGSGSVLGRPLGDVSARKKMGYLPEQFRYQPWMTGAELLDFHCRLFKLPKSRQRIDDALLRVGLADQGKKKVGGYSKGMQQRIGLAVALLPDPQLLFLDEPTSALDPIGRKEVRDIISSLRDNGTTVFLNSHLLSEVESVCDSIAIIHHGEVARFGKMSDLLESKVTLRLRADGLDDACLASLREHFDENLQIHADSAITLALKSRDLIPEIAAFIVNQGAKLHELTPEHETLESAFLRIVGEDQAPPAPQPPLYPSNPYQPNAAPQPQQEPIPDRSASEEGFQ